MKFSVYYFLLNHASYFVEAPMIIWQVIYDNVKLSAMCTYHFCRWYSVYYLITKTIFSDIPRILTWNIKCIINTSTVICLQLNNKSNITSCCVHCKFFRSQLSYNQSVVIQFIRKQIAKIDLREIVFIIINILQHYV